MCNWRLCPSGLLATVFLLLPTPSVSQATPDPNVIHTGTHVVLVNVVAKDKHGKPVNDLTRDDFVLRDNGREQKIGLFALENAEVGGSAATVSNTSGNLTFSNRPGVAGITVFLFDELNTQLGDQELAKKDFLRYLRGLPADSRVAVFVLGDSLSLLHDFTQDMASLVKALDGHSNRANPEVTAATATPGSANSITGDQTTSMQWDSFVKSSNQAYVDYTQMVRATRTAVALETIAGHLQGIPGRKTLIWISGGFPIQLGLRSKVDRIPDSQASARESGAATGSRQSGSDRGDKSESKKQSYAPTASLTSNLPGTGTSFENDVALAIRALNEADVAVYPVDARGVTVAGPYQANQSSIGKRGKRPRGASGPVFEYETLEMLADQTGGKAFHQINDLGEAIQEAASDARVSYSLTFSPVDSALDGAYHRLEVTVKRADVKLRFRPGYVAARDAAVAPSLRDAIANPVALTGIGFAVHLEPVEGGYKMSVIIDPHNITLEPKDGKWTGSMQFVVVVGKVEQLTTVPLDFTEALFRQIQDQGLHFSARVKTPPGTTGFSVGFRDISSGLVGTLQVPL
jgi:VWFA-related protein